MNRYKYNLLELCQNIHMTATGAMDPAFSYEDAHVIYDWLKWRIFTDWTESHINKFAEYDRHVKALCTEAFHELEAWLEQYDKELADAIDKEQDKNNS